MRRSMIHPRSWHADKYPVITDRFQKVLFGCKDQDQCSHRSAGWQASYIFRVKVPQQRNNHPGRYCSIRVFAYLQLQARGLYLGQFYFALTNPRQNLWTWKSYLPDFSQYLYRDYLQYVEKQIP